MTIVSEFRTKLDISFYLKLKLIYIEKKLQTNSCSNMLKTVLLGVLYLEWIIEFVILIYGIL